MLCCVEGENKSQVFVCSRALQGFALCCLQRWQGRALNHCHQGGPPKRASAQPVFGKINYFPGWGQRVRKKQRDLLTRWRDCGFTPWFSVSGHWAGHFALSLPWFPHLQRLTCSFQPLPCFVCNAPYLEMTKDVEVDLKYRIGSDMCVIENHSILCLLNLR